MAEEQGEQGEVSGQKKIQASNRSHRNIDQSIFRGVCFLIVEPLIQ